MDSCDYKPTRQAFGSPGGKSYLAPRIATMMPPHKVYVEPFVGGGAVFYRKRPSVVEVLNDKDTEIIFANRFMRDMTKEDFSKLQKFNWVKEEKRFKDIRAMNPKDDYERFYKFYYLKKSRFGAGGGFNHQSAGESINLDKLWGAHERLDRVKLHSGDYMKMIDKYDSPDTFFYLDPPYPNRTAQGFVGGFTEDDTRALMERLDKIKGKFIVSLASEDVKYIPKHWHIRRIKCFRRIPKDHGNNSERAWSKTYQYEILVSKQPIIERPQSGNVVEVDFKKKPDGLARRMTSKPQQRKISNSRALVTARR